MSKPKRRFNPNKKYFLTKRDSESWGVWKRTAPGEAILMAVSWWQGSDGHRDMLEICSALNHSVKPNPRRPK
jgi:hypothetical protein